MTKIIATWRWLLLAVLLLGLAWRHELEHPVQAGVLITQQTGVAGEFAPGEILVTFKPGVTRAASLLSNMETTVVETLAACSTGQSATGYRVRVPAGREAEAISNLQRNEAVLFAEPNWLVYAADRDDTNALAQPERPFLVNDPDYVSQLWHLQRVGASRAWGLAFGSDGFRGELTTVQVAVVDSGVDLNHPEFSGILLPGANYTTANDTDPPQDRYGHGTHVAGSIGALLNNGVGVAGVAPRVKIDPRKVLNDSGSGSIANVAQGICDAADAGANIINLSLETPQLSMTLQNAVRYAAGKGILLVAASGNSGAPTVAYPAAFAEVMAIGATTIADLRASYSNYQATAPIIDLVAPGGGSGRAVYSTWAKGAWCREERAPLPDSGYCNSEGTSMAAAVVTGAAALLLSIDCNLTANELRTLLTNTAAPIAGSPNEIGSGRLDLHAAVRKLLPSDLSLSHRSLLHETSQNGPPYTMTVRLDNPSGQPIDWQMTLLDTPAWVRLLDADNSGSLNGQARYGKPSHVTFIFDSNGASSGIFRTTAEVIGTRTDTTQVFRQVAVDLLIGNLTPKAYLPFVVQQREKGNTIPPPPLSTWETPTNATDRTTLALTDEGSSLMRLPFSFTLQALAYDAVTISANGFVSFDSDPEESHQNRCLPNNDAATAAVYGWWADLDPSRVGAQVSTFQPANDRFVIEYANAPSAAKSGQNYTVSFQIVLYRNGDIGLNYGSVPAQQFQPPPVTIGVEAREGLLYNQIVCKDANTELGILPAAQQSIYLKAEEGAY